MRCQSCGLENAASKKFCIRCGATLSPRCPKCGSENPLEARFCGDCGAALSQPAAAPHTTGGAPAPIIFEDGQPREISEGERRHLTVLFCDLVGSTEIASHLDPEQWREIVGEYHSAAAQAIERFGGRVAQYLGDGVMAYFGYPEAHDNDAERAARGGLAILDALSKFNERSTYPKLAARVGIDSGMVVVGTGAGKEADAFGDTPNIAARVQAAAEPGTVIITDAAHRLVSGLFVVEDRGARALKGVQRPVQLYRVVQPSGVRGRLEAAAARGLTPFVGREDELRSLMNRWERALDGEGQMALIIGEAGIGKSRLEQRFHEQIAGTPHTWVEAAAGAFFQNTPFYAVTEMLRELLAWRGDESGEEQLAQLETRLELAGLKPAEALPLIAPLLNLPLPAKYPPSPLSPEQQRRRLLATLVEWALSAARAQPTVIAIEDLHWADPSTLELLQLLVEQGATARLLLLLTARPEFHAPWTPRAHHAQITLTRLSARNVRSMVGDVAAQKALPEETIATVLERTGGVPLFVEELTRAVLESGDARLTGRQIPVTLHDSLMARLDRLGPAKEVVQVGAVIGSEYSYELLHAVYPIAEEELQRALRALADAELLYVRGIAPEATYLFKHALIRDAAYEALLKSRRKELHRLVARTMAEKLPAFKEMHPEVLARHWTEAGETEPAIAEWQRAGARAIERRAYREAEQIYRSALALLEALPQSLERDARELGLREALAETLRVTRGYSAPETVDATARARALAEAKGNLAQLVVQDFLAWTVAFSAGDYATATVLADRALSRARTDGGAASLGFAHMAQVATRYFRGDLVGAEDYFTRGTTFFMAPAFRQFPGAASNLYSLASQIAFIMGWSDKSRKRMQDALAVARENNNPFDLATAQSMLSAYYVFRREAKQVEAPAAQALALSEKHGGFPFVSDTCRMSLGWARANLGDAEGGIGLIRQGLVGWAEAKARLGWTRCLILLAQVQLFGGATGDALTTIEQAMEENPDELLDRPEALRIRGELRLMHGRAELAEHDIGEAIAVAQKISAKAWELRATTSLARLLASQGRSEEARTKLAEIYRWFTEGSDTLDLKDAKALLDALSA
jgi:class 3 adenylate cyclase/tetratricopeptide (TPR) repeat protein